MSASRSDSPVAASAATGSATDRIRALNDELRQFGRGGRVMVTSGVTGLTELERAALLAAVQGFTAFDDDNDPHGEHDFGAVEAGGARCFWKIDYYDRELSFASPDPADPALTMRVLTVMLAEEY